MPETTDSPSSSKRLLSLDAYRGFVMLAMASGGLGLWKVAEKFPDNKLWEILGHESSHVEWSGCDVLGFDSAVVHVHGRRGAARSRTPIALPAETATAGSPRGAHSTARLCWWRWACFCTR